MRTIVLAALAIIAGMAGPATSQINPTLSEAERGVRDGKAADEAKHLRIDALDVSAHIVGRTADMTVELRITSDNSEPFEGNLALVLPTNAVVTGYALDVDGRLIDGILLEQPKARNLYEAEVRRGIDPGLAEVSAGNRFTTRIFPIDSKHPRRFRLRFSAPFDPAQGIVLPLARDAVIDRVRVDVTVDGFATPPDVRFAGKSLALKAAGASWNVGTAVDRAPLREGLTINGGTPVGALTVAEHASGARFFVIADQGDKAPAQPAQGGRLRIYWDRSLSHRADRIDLETEALIGLVYATAPTAIDLVTFASDRPAMVTVRDAAGLRAALAKIVYRGGTSLAGLDKMRLAAADRCVMVFDGQVTIDHGTTFAPDCRLAMMSASTGADGARLGRIAQGTNGIVVRLVEGHVADAAAALARPGAGVTSVRDDAGRALAFRALPAASGGWLIVGQLPEAGSVRVGLAGFPERRYAASGPAIRSDAAGALWAAQRVNELGDDPARHAQMVDVARRFQVAGPGMSFLVLETADQYVRADIAPSSGFSETWMQTYREAKRIADTERADAKTERLTFVLKAWNDRKAWWNTRFVPSRRAKRGAQETADLAPPPAPAPLPAPPEMQSTPLAVMAPSPPASASANEAAADVVVTSARANTRPAARDGRAGGAAEIKLDLADVLAKRPYLAALDAAPPGARLTVLGEQERAYGSVPTFYLDVAEWFRIKGDAATADLLLLSALELPTSDDETRQIVAFRLERDKAYDRAVEIAERLAAANAEFRPQPARDLALALTARGRSMGKAGRADLERAFTLLTQTALNPASKAFDGIEVIALMEANALIPRIQATGGRWTLDRRLVDLLDTDARIVIGWTADDADIDLWVDEPNGERVFYRESLSSAGGQISNDMTDGYGPEEYAIHHAPAGAYQVRINGYDADRINPNGPGHVLIRLTRNFARSNEQEVMIDADLAFQQGRDRNDESDTLPVATLRVAKN